MGTPKSLSFAGVKNDIAYVALGSNLGSRENNLAAARRAISMIPGTSILAESAVEETAPIGPLAQGPFLNQMIALRTRLEPRELLLHLQRVEAEGGRVRDVHWGPRSIDLDIVQYGCTTCTDADLMVPHPQLPNREFWQHELAELKLLLVQETGAA